MHGRGDARWVWRCHIDTSEPNPDVWGFLRPFLVQYDAAVFTLGGFVPPELPIRRVEIIPPAIDPRSPKNLDLDVGLSRGVLGWIGVDVELPRRIRRRPRALHRRTTRRRVLPAVTALPPLARTAALGGIVALLGALSGLSSDGPAHPCS